MPTINRPRDCDSISLGLSNLNPQHILDKIEWMNAPITTEEVKTFLKNLETAVFKYLIYEQTQIEVLYRKYYKARKYSMVAQLKASLTLISLSKESINEELTRSSFHSCYTFDHDGGTDYIRKKGVIPLKTLPLLINNESETTRLLAKAKLQGFL